MQNNSKLKQLGSLYETPDKKFKSDLRARLQNQISSIKLQDLSSKQPTLIESFTNIFRAQPLLSGLFSLATVLAAVFGIGLVTSTDNILDLRKSTIPLEVASNVESANVYINDKFVGITPLKYDLPEGDYSIRVEKDGYTIYAQEIKVDDNVDSEQQVVANLTNEEDIYALWNEYENNEMNIKLHYPNGWNLSEEKTEAGIKVTASNGDNEIDYYIGQENIAALSSSEAEQVDSIYKKEFKVGESIQSRYLNFDKEGNFVDGFLELDSTVAQMPVKAVYELKGTEEEILNSDIVKQLDLIVQSVEIKDQKLITAIEGAQEIKIENNNPKSENVLAGTVTKDPVALVTNTPAVILAKAYTNNTYSYTIGYPEEWRVRSSRADFPYEDRGYSLKLANGDEVKVARLELVDQEGNKFNLYIVPGNQNLDIINDTCKNNSYYKLIDNKRLVRSATTKDKYQLCNTTGGTFTVNSSNEILFSYAIVVDLETTENISDSMFGTVKSIVRSFNVYTGQVDTGKTDKTYVENDLGVTFDYSYNWSIREIEFDCIDEGMLVGCIRVIVSDEKGNPVLEFIDEPIALTGGVATSIQTSSGTISLSLLSNAGEQNVYAYGKLNNSKVNIIVNQSKGLEVLESLRF